MFGQSNEVHTFGRLEQDNHIDMERESTLLHLPWKQASSTQEPGGLHDLMTTMPLSPAERLSQIEVVSTWNAGKCGDGVVPHVGGAAASPRREVRCQAGTGHDSWRNQRSSHDVLVRMGYSWVLRHPLQNYEHDVATPEIRSYPQLRRRADQREWRGATGTL